jgi:ABC-type uncharacterized transport system YnjBCD permease subunit
MLRSALALLSSLQVGLRLKESIERSIRQAAIIAVAVVILLGAIAFGLVAGYQVLMSHYGFSPAHAAGIMAAFLFLLAMLVLATLPLFAPRPRRRVPSMSMAAGEGVGLIDKASARRCSRSGPLPCSPLPSSPGSWRAGA